jgi:hypothetical protein
MATTHVRVRIELVEYLRAVRKQAKQDNCEYYRQVTRMAEDAIEGLIIAELSVVFPDIPLPRSLARFAKNNNLKNNSAA